MENLGLIRKGLVIFSAAYLSTLRKINVGNAIMSEIMPTTIQRKNVLRPV